MKRVLLVGLGAEIGATLLALNRPADTGFEINTAVTREIAGGANDSGSFGLDSAVARIVLADPTTIDAVGIDERENSVVVNGNATTIFWGDAQAVDSSTIEGHFDVAIIATSKAHIGDPKFMNKWATIADRVVGVSEAPNLPAIYSNLHDAPTRWLGNQPRKIGEDQVFCLGSCQSNGWHGVLRGFLGLLDEVNPDSFKMRGLEVDIVHPDTPTGRLGTKSLEPRDQDPRDNLRPSFSQIEGSMRLLFPGAHCVNSVSLRTLVQPPGYQISRIFFSYTGGDPITREKVVGAFERQSVENPFALRMSHMPLGSRAFAFAETSAVVLSGAHYLLFEDDPFALRDNGGEGVSELLVQSYVHNVRAYCRSVLNVVSNLCGGGVLRAFYPG